MADLSWQQQLQQEQNAAKQEWMALERRYHAQLVSGNDDGMDTDGCQIRIFITLSDPDLTMELKGESELLLMLPQRYPVDPPQLDFQQWSTRLTQSQIAALNDAFKARAAELRGTFSVRKLLTWLDNNIYQILFSSTENGNDLQQSDERVEVSVASTEVDEHTQPIKQTRSRKPCHFFARGKCKSGEECKFSHEIKTVKKKKASNEEKIQDKNGVNVEDSTKLESCDAQADTPHPPSTTKNARFCKFFANNKCKAGDNCKFSHERKSKQKSLQIVQQDENEKPSMEVIDLEKADEIRDSKDLEDKPTSSAEWTPKQQRQLDLALKKYPASMDKKERWASIASEVQDRSLNECIDRFKLLCQIVREQQKNEKETAIPVIKDDNPPLADLEHNEDNARDARIIPSISRIAIETEPEVRGTQIALEDLFLHQVGTIVPHRLICQIQCSNCPLKFDAKLALDDSHVQKWCPRCSVLHVVSLRPVFAHAQSNILAYVDTENCSLVDVLPSDLLATCLDCGNEVLLTNVTARRRSEQACFSCHTKLAIMTKRYVVGHLTTVESNTKHSSQGPSKTVKKVVETFPVGQPLPRNGACDHYKHSLRWFRFQCCGKAFPCDVCHDSSDCPDANTGKIASRMICGLCSKEQSSSVKMCMCGNEVGAKRMKSSHWEGGAGCRNPNLMSQNDKQKYRGLNKTASKKFKRVGTEGKKRVETRQ